MAKQRFKSAQWFDTLYGTTYVLLCGDPEKAKAWLHRRPRFADIEFEAEGADGMASKKNAEGYNYVIVWVRRAPEDDYSFGILVHEMYHAMMYTFRRIGLKQSKKSEEAHSYYMQWLVEEALKRI